jgi:hypothetical protein
LDSSGLIECVRSKCSAAKYCAPLQRRPLGDEPQRFVFLAAQERPHVSVPGFFGTGTPLRVNKFMLEMFPPMD